ncbi:MAG: ATP-binding protein [Betaproteobacteria bacterium]|nr:ATP-binding protein [Betaproteobacteria bacterium]
MDKEYPRWQSESVKKALKIRRVVIVSGARQSGKTTLSNQILSNDCIYRTLDDPGLLAAALEDPKGFVKNPSQTMVIDEIQKAPALLPAIKQVVDNDNRPGQYLLTGSANIQTLPSVSESLAGRVKNIRLRPFTVGEVLGKSPSFLKRAFAADFPVKIPGYGKESLFDLAFRGGYPEAVRINDGHDRKEWHKDYVSSLIERDLRDIANIRRQASLRELVGVLASWSAKFMDVSGISASLAVSKATVESYMNALVSLYLFDRVPPWLRTDYDRVGRRPKFYAADTGMMASILGWNAKEAYLDPDRSGKLAETFAFHELAAQVELDGQYALYQYRDREKREIDFIIEHNDGSMVGVEAKAGQSVSKGDFGHMEWFKDNIAKKPFKGIVLYTGEDTLSFGKDMLAVPMASLWAEMR